MSTMYLKVKLIIICVPECTHYVHAEFILLKLVANVSYCVCINKYISMLKVFGGRISTLYSLMTNLNL